MTRYAIIRQSTDSHSPRSKVEFTASKRVVSAALDEKMKLTYADPAGDRNWHHDITSIYELPIGWRKPSEKYLSEESIRRSSSSYPRSQIDILAGKIMCDGDRITEIV
jgi:hypothetical protein